MLLDTPILSSDVTRQHPVRVLVLCTGNSARSVMAEALLNHLGKPWIQAVSAGSRPVGRVNSYAIEQIRTHLNDDGSRYYSKSWDQFAQAHTNDPIDIVLTVCPNAAQEQCPIFPGSAHNVHWSFADPAATAGNPDAIRATFSTTFLEMQMRIAALMKLPLECMSNEQIANALQALSKRGNE